MNYNLKKILLYPFDLLYDFNPKFEIQLMFFLKQGYRLNLDNPQTYNEKLNWQKLFYKNDLMSLCSDKYLVRDFVKDRGYDSNLNTLLWDGFCPEDIPLQNLPQKFVIKVTHGSGFNIICKDKEELDFSNTKKKLKQWLDTKYIKCYGETWYGRKKPRIIVEKFLENDDGKPLFDYKFFCYRGEPEFVYVDTWKNGNHHINMYDVNFSLLKGVSLGYPSDLDSDIKKPINYDDMLKMASDLSKGFPHVRVDLYNVNNSIVFGEMTFSKGAGFDKILPYDFDLRMGKNFILEERHDY